MSIFLLRQWLKRIQEDLLSNNCQFSSCSSQTWAFPSGIRWIWVVILGRKLNPAHLLKSACCWGRPTQFCSLFFLCFSVRVVFGDPLASSPSVLAHAIRFEGVWLHTSPTGRCCQNCCHYVLKSVFEPTMTSSDRCSLYLHRFGAFEMSWSNTPWKWCPGYPPQCHSLVLDFFFFSFCVNAMYMIQDAQ